MHALALFFAPLLFSLSTPSIHAKAKKHLNIFCIDLIHRDSPLSPFYNSTMTQSELIQKAALRSMSRVNRFHLSMDESSEFAAETDIIPNDGSYLMKIFIGTPPVQRWTVADTGSDLVWVQCSPCPTPRCYYQDVSLFDPTKSSTYMLESCGSKNCALLPEGHSICGSSNQCAYYYTYGDRSYTVGELATDSINFGASDDQSILFPKSVFGCGHNNNGKFNKNVAGLVGLGNGPLSLVSQLGDEIGRQFSYCLPPFDEKSTSKLRFGEEAAISGNGVVSTPLITKPRSPTYYYLNLEGITVGQKTVQTGQSDGNIIIDSGTTLTYLPSSFYEEVEALMKEAIGADEAVVQNPPEPFKLCYASQTSIKNVPDFVVHFKEADLSLKPLNFFLPMDPNNLPCFAMVPSDRFSLYGNVAQFNFQVEHDLDGRKVSFAPADCSKQ